MFGRGKVKSNINENELDTLRQKQRLELERIKQEHALELQQKDFDVKHFKDDKLQELESQLADSNKRIAVLEKENSMLDRIVDLNGDILDIKELVTKLIDKLPTIDITSITAGDNK